MGPLVARLLAAALERATFTLEELADAAGVKRDTAYKVRQRYDRFFEQVRLVSDGGPKRRGGQLVKWALRPDARAEIGVLLRSFFPPALQWSIESESSRRTPAEPNSFLAAFETHNRLISKGLTEGQDAHLAEFFARDTELACSEVADLHWAGETVPRIWLRKLFDLTALGYAIDVGDPTRQIEKRELRWLQMMRKIASIDGDLWRRVATGDPACVRLSEIVLSCIKDYDDLITVSGTRVDVEFASFSGAVALLSAPSVYQLFCLQIQTALRAIPAKDKIGIGLNGDGDRLTIALSQQGNLSTSLRYGQMDVESSALLHLSKQLADQHGIAISDDGSLVLQGARARSVQQAIATSESVAPTTSDGSPGPRKRSTLRSLLPGKRRPRLATHRQAGYWQTTLAREIELSGMGVHSGAFASMALHPAEADTGYRFLISKRGTIVAEIPGHIDYVKNLTLTTVLGDDSGTTIGGVEHLLAALRGLSIDNCCIEIDAREVPIMDGSAARFVEAIDESGIRELREPRRYLKVLKTVRVEEGDVVGELAPCSRFQLDVEIDFATPVIGRQRFALDVHPSSFRNELSRARQFGFMRDVEGLWKAGLALGASLDNTVVLSEDRVMNPEGLRYSQEFVRHKMLDAVGDMALAGAPILGSHRSVRGGHRVNAYTLQKLLADKNAWSMVRGAASERASDAGRLFVGLPQPILRGTD